MPALASIRFNDQLRSYFHRRVKEGLCKMSAVVATMPNFQSTSDHSLSDTKNLLPNTVALTFRPFGDGIQRWT